MITMLLSCKTNPCLNRTMPATNIWTPAVSNIYSAGKVQHQDNIHWPANTGGRTNTKRVKHSAHQWPHHDHWPETQTCQHTIISYTREARSSRIPGSRCRSWPCSWLAAEWCGCWAARHLVVTTAEQHRQQQQQHVSIVEWVSQNSKQMNNCCLTVITCM